MAKGTKNFMDEQDAAEVERKRRAKKRKLLTETARNDALDKTHGEGKGTSKTKPAKKSTAEISVTIPMVLKRETPGTYFYEAAQDNEFVKSLYVSKKGVEGAAPKKLMITLEG